MGWIQCRYPYSSEAAALIIGESQDDKNHCAIQSEEELLEVLRSAASYESLALIQIQELVKAK